MRPVVALFIVSLLLLAYPSEDRPSTAEGTEPGAPAAAEPPLAAAPPEQSAGDRG